MAAINDLIAQIENPELRARIQAEVDRMNKQKKFGLVFEEHLPECTPLYDIPVKRGALVALKTGKVSEVYRVLKIKGDEAECKKKDADEIATFKVNELVTVAEFGDAIYPYLKPMDSVCNAPDSDLWHTLIEADNYHALQLLEYLYAGKVDCIYIEMKAPKLIQINYSSAVLPRGYIFGKRVHFAGRVDPGCFCFMEVAA